MTKRNIIVIGTSADGVEALSELSKHLPENLDASVFVVLHIGDESLLAEILNHSGKLPAVTATHNKRINAAAFTLPRRSIICRSRME